MKKKRMLSQTQMFELQVKIRLVPPDRNQETPKWD